LWTPILDRRIGHNREVPSPFSFFYPRLRLSYNKNFFCRSVSVPDGHTAYSPCTPGRYVVSPTYTVNFLLSEVSAPADGHTVHVLAAVR